MDGTMFGTQMEYCIIATREDGQTHYENVNASGDAQIIAYVNAKGRAMDHSWTYVIRGTDSRYVSSVYVASQRIEDAYGRGR